MKKLFAKTICLALFAAAVLAAIFYYAYFVMPPTFDDSYQKGFNYQYHALERADGQPKIIVWGGSYVNFSVDSDLLASLSQRPSYTLGINSAMGMSFVSESAKRFINKGDILVFPFMPFWKNDFGMDLIYLCLEEDWDLFTHFAKKHPFAVAKSFPRAIFIKMYNVFHKGIKKNLLKKEAMENPSYRADAFDKETGNYIFPRPSILPDISPAELEPSIRRDKDFINVTCFDVLNELNDFCKNKGAALYIAFPPAHKGSVASSAKEKADYESYLKKNIDAPIISTLSENEFPKDCIYNSAMHLNDKGVELYTKQLYEDLKHCNAL